MVEKKKVQSYPSFESNLKIHSRITKLTRLYDFTDYLYLKEYVIMKLSFYA